jgi:outer membrane protein assembly factor BamB
MSFSAAVGADWPQWRSDANRSGATGEPGPTEPRRLWRLDFGRPDPAYDHQYRMCADVTYAPVAAEGLAFIPSNVADQVVACDLETGAVRWRFVTEGPVRFAPLYYRGNVYFGSDDGYLRCVSAQGGKLLWKVRGAPDALPDSRMLAGGRLTSRWPVRGAPVEHQGAIYFGAGVWPEEGVYVCAVRAETGQVLWRSDRMSYIKNGMSDHGRAYDLSMPPQGYLAIIDGKLAVPSGRSLAAWFDPATGEMEPYTCFYVKHNPPRGTWYLSGIRQYCVQGGNWFGTRPGAMPSLPADWEDAKSALFWSREPVENERYVLNNRPFLRADTYRLHPENLYTEPVLTETTMYASEFAEEEKYLVPRGHTHVAFPAYDRIVARDLTRPRWTSVRHRHVGYGNRAVKMPRLEFPLLWELESPLRVLIKAGDRLYAGGEDTVAAIGVPKQGEEPRVAWRASVDGTPVHALVAERKLVVVTHNGNVFCFGDDAGNPPAADTAPNNEADTPRNDEADPAPNNEADTPRNDDADPAPNGQADAVSNPQEGRYTSPRNGYACLLGCSDMAQARSLAREHGYRVIVFEPDPAKVAAARKDVIEARLSARQVQVVQASLDETFVTPYWANLVVCESVEKAGAPEAVLTAALDLLRPYTGRLRLPNGRPFADLLERLLADRTGYAMRLDGPEITVDRRAPPEGADDWTHEAGGPDNAFANSDRLVQWPLAALWYSGDVDRYFTPPSHFQHERHPYPLVVGGRMFLITGQHLHAIDVYTGSYLWKAQMPMTPWVQTRFFDSRIYGRPTERNCVAAPDWVYAVTGEKIHAYDAATGRQVNVFEIPPPLQEPAQAAIRSPREVRYMGHRATIQAAPLWTEVRLCDDLLLAMVGRNMLAMDRHTGDLRWTRPSTRQTTVYALGDAMLFGLDCDAPPLGGGQSERPTGLLFAMTPQTGEVAWQKHLDYSSVPKHAVDHPRLWLRPVVPVLSYNAKHDLIVMTVNRNSLHVFRGADGSPVWSKTNPASGNLQRVYPPVVTDDYLLLSQYKGCFGYLLDVRTGEEVGENTGIPRPRTCARVIGNNHLLVYRDAATELYDIQRNRMIGLNSVRSGCTTSFIPADGIITAPMLGHGCVCNYPMFASLALYHWPGIEEHRPASVRNSWVNQAEQLLAQDAEIPDVFTSDTDGKIDVQRLHPINCTVEAFGSGLRLSTKDQDAGYAVRRSGKPLEKAVFTFAVTRAPGSRRHGNAFFVCGPSENPRDWIQCRLYYGGRSSMMITGSGVDEIEQKRTFARRGVFHVTVRVDCEARTVTFETDVGKLTSRITASIGPITHYGCGGANSDNLFTDIEVR